MTTNLITLSNITYVATDKLKHIESFSKKRVTWLVKKIQTEQVWTKPLCVDKNHFLVMDGQHRMESAKILGLKYVPCVLFDYTEVEIWSLRDNYLVDHDTVINRSLNNDIYPYKTVKHRFPMELPELSIPLSELLQLDITKVNEKCA